MGIQYNDYLEKHRSNVIKAYNWLKEHLPEVARMADEHDIFFRHDESKYSVQEYAAYDAYFYGGNRSAEVVKNFNHAWLHHIHNNPHHWQYWILINDDPNLGEIVLDMPMNYIVEMICDWWSFSFIKDDLSEIFRWYEERKEYMRLSPKTRTWVESILNGIRGVLEGEKTDED